MKIGLLKTIKFTNRSKSQRCDPDKPDTRELVQEDDLFLAWPNTSMLLKFSQMCIHNMKQNEKKIMSY